MKKIYLLGFAACAILFIVFSQVWATEFTMTISVENKSNNWKRYFLKKGRILEIASIDISHFQSIIITEGDGLILIPPLRTMKRTIKGICLHKGLNFPSEGDALKLTPFVVQEELIGADQETVHALIDLPSENIKLIIGRGYSDAVNNGRQLDREEAFKNAVFNVCRQVDVAFESKASLKNLSLAQNIRKITLGDFSISLKRNIHEDYNEEIGEYLFISEFEVIKKAPVSRVQR